MGGAPSLENWVQEMVRKVPGLASAAVPSQTGLLSACDQRHSRCMLLHNMAGCCRP